MICAASVFIVGRWRYTGMRQVFPQQFDVGFGTGVAVVWMVQEEFDAVEHDAEACAMTTLDSCAEVMQQRFNFAPVNVGANRVGKDGMQQVGVLVAHSGLPPDRSTCET